MSRGPSSRLLSVVWLILALMVWVAPVPAEPQTPENLDRIKAMKLTGEGKMLEALPLLEKLYKSDPRDVSVAEALAQALVTQSPTLDAADRPKSLIKARAILVELDRQGTKLSNLSAYYLTYIPIDGEIPSFSGKTDADEAMRLGEAEFSRRAFDKARTHYLKAYSLDPTNSVAALFIGDTYFAANNPKDAAEWFARATRINPQHTAAWRYWGDALTKLGQQAEARDKYCEAVLTEPYSMPPWMSLRQWARIHKIPAVHPRVLPDNLAPKTIRIARVEDGTIHVALYERRRAEWQAKRFNQAFPKESEYRHSMAEEADALRAVAQAVTRDKKDGKVKTLDPDLARLLTVEESGLLEAYVLLARPDQGIAQDFEAYRAAHADRLLSYLKTFVVPMEPQAK